MWEEFVPQLGERHRIVPVDLPGHGSASPLSSKWTVAAIADAVMADLHSLADEYVLLGASLGGMVAQELAVRKPQKLSMLILVDTLSSVMPRQQSAIRRRAESAREGGMAALMEDTIQRWFTPSFIRERGAEVTRVRSILAGCNPEFHAACWEAIAGFDIEDRISAIRVPVCTVVGSEDISTPPSVAQAIAESVPDGQCIIIPAAGHMSMIEKPEEFASIVSEVTLG
jgi:3-oxoadipate enol-lactonase